LNTTIPGASEPKTARNEAGTETRPFLSILFTKLDKNTAMKKTPEDNVLAHAKNRNYLFEIRRMYSASNGL